MRSVTGVKYMTMGAQNVKTIEEAETAITKKIQDDNMENTHLLFVIADTGRGDSKKRVKILPNYKVSKNLGYTQYVLSIIEGTETTESIAFAANPDMIVNGYNQSMTSMVNSNSNQVICSMKSNGPSLLLLLLSWEFLRMISMLLTLCSVALIRVLLLPSMSMLLLPVVLMVRMLLICRAIAVLA